MTKELLRLGSFCASESNTSASIFASGLSLSAQLINQLTCPLTEGLCPAARQARKGESGLQILSGRGQGRAEGFPWRVRAGLMTCHGVKLSTIGLELPRPCSRDLA